MPKRVEGVVAMKQHFVLVHGIGGGSWCWYKIRCLMENSGCKVSCIDLKSAGIDQSDADSVLSFDDYNKPLMDFMSDLPENEQVVIWYQLYMLILVPPYPFMCLFLHLMSCGNMWLHRVATSTWTQRVSVMWFGCYRLYWWGTALEGWALLRPVTSLQTRFV